MKQLHLYFNNLNILAVSLLLLAVLLLSTGCSDSNGASTYDEDQVAITEPGSIDIEEPITVAPETTEPETVIEEPVLPEVPEGKVLVMVDKPREEHITFAVDEESYHMVITELTPDNETVSLSDFIDNAAFDDFIAHLSSVEYNFTNNQIGITTDPGSFYVISNKLNKLPNDYAPENLRIPDVLATTGEDVDKRYLVDEAATAIEELFAAAKEDGLDLFCASGYRSYSKQESIYSSQVSRRGLEEADQVSARPGHSEHQTGLAMDVTCEAVGFALEEEFGQLPEGIFVAEHAHEYGLTIRYYEDTIDITGYNYEPWHLRYVGVELATYLYEHQLTMEELYVALYDQMYLYVEEE